MLKRKERQDKIKEVVSKYEIATQEELADYLAKEGVHSTQATLSRDIHSIHLIKSCSNGRYRYRLPSTGDLEISQKYRTILVETVISADYSMSTAVIKTYSGMANAAAAVIDGMNSSDILGTIAGDDTIFVLLRDEATASLLAQQIKEFIEDK